MSYHDPVLLQECIRGLAIDPEGVYVDVTFGGGGHSREILKNLDQGSLYGFDQDQDAAEEAEKIDDSRFHFIQANFRYLKKYLKVEGVHHVNGILADLGVSSHQFDVPERGFSTRFDAPLDMRMDQSGKKTAMQVLNEYSEGELHRIFGQYGEVRNARTLAARLVGERAVSPLETTGQLTGILESLAPRGRSFQYFAQVFQALRIEVNDELKVLEEFLESSAELLEPGGRLVVISYHSLEDRLVKNYMAKGRFFGEVEKDFYGNMIRPLEPVTRKPILPDKNEIDRNSRARSAKLRVAEKIK